MRTTLPIFFLLLAACPDSGTGSTSDSETGTSHETSHHETSHETLEDPTSGGSTAHASHGETEHATGTTEHAHETDTTGHSHETDTTGHEHESEGHETDHATDPHETATGEPGSPAGAYCGCMVVNCHDQYHGTWGEEHPQSEEMCLAAAEMLPSVGMPAESGDSIECRMHFCELAQAGDESACESAIGGGACM